MKPAPSPAAWFADIVAASPDAFTKRLRDAARRVLEQHGVPYTRPALRRVIDRPGNSEPIHMLDGAIVLARITSDSQQPEPVRLAVEIIWRAAGVRYWIAKTNARNTAAETARLFGAVVRALEIDAEPYLRAGIAQVKNQKAGTTANQAKADKRREIVAEFADQEQTKHPKFKPDRIHIRVAERAKQEHPDLFKSTYSKTSVRNLLEKK